MGLVLSLLKSLFSSVPGLALFFLFVPDAASRFINLGLRSRTPGAGERHQHSTQGETWVSRRGASGTWLGGNRTHRQGQTDPASALGALTPHYLSLEANWTKRATAPTPWLCPRAGRLRGTKGSSCPDYNWLHPPAHICWPKCPIWCCLQWNFMMKNYFQEAEENISKQPFFFPPEVIGFNVYITYMAMKKLLKAEIPYWLLMNFEFPHHSWNFTSSAFGLQLSAVESNV